MPRLLCTALLFSTLAAAVSGQPAEPVLMELMTYPEVYSAIHEHGKTTVLIYNGGTEQRGPQAVLGGHTLIARRAAEAIARRLGNALVAPVLPFSPSDEHLNPKWPGTVSIPAGVFTAVNEAVAASMVVNGFKNIVLMGDHGGGQAELKSLAKRLDLRYRPKGVRVYYCGAIYGEAKREFDASLAKKGLPTGNHASIEDTSEMMYLGGDGWVRKDKLEPGNSRNGVSGDPRLSTAGLGKEFFDLRVADAVREIESLTGR